MIEWRASGRADRQRSMKMLLIVAMLSFVGASSGSGGPSGDLPVRPRTAACSGSLAELGLAVLDDAGVVAARTAAKRACEPPLSYEAPRRLETAAWFEGEPSFVMSRTVSSEAGCNAAMTELATPANVGAALAMTVSESILLVEELVVSEGSAAYVRISSEARSALVSGGGERLVHVLTGSTLHLENLELRDGVALYEADFVDPRDRGGCLYLEAGARAVVKSVTFDNCTSYLGGAVSGDRGSLIEVEGSTILNSYAFIGGGLASRAGTVHFRSSTIAGCTTSYAAGGIGMFDTVTVGGTLHVSGSTIRDCTSPRGGGGIAGPAFGVMSVADSVISNTTAGVGGGASIHFGASTMTYANVVFQGCVVQGTEFESGGGAIMGFDIGTTVPATCVITDSVISQCTAGGQGGGILGLATHAYWLAGTTIAGCTAQGGGGGGVQFKASLDLSRGSRISNCVGEKGGGIAINNIGSVLRLVDSTVDGNVATLTDGGGIAAPKDSRVFLFRSSITGNAAPNGVGGALASAGGKVWLLAGTSLSKNTALSGGGLALTTDDQRVEDSSAPTEKGGLKGRLYSSGDRCAFVELQLDFELGVDNTANTYSLIQAAGQGTVRDARGRTMLIEPTSGRLQLSELCLPASEYRIFFTSMAGGNYGGSTTWARAAATLLGPLQDENATTSSLLSFSLPGTDWQTRMATQHPFRVEEAGDEGGRVLISDNVATRDGGALLISHESGAFLMETDFAGNSALEGGGAAYLDGVEAQLEATQCIFANNTAGKNGGAVAATSDTTVRLEDSVVYGNVAHHGSGGFGHFERCTKLEFNGTIFRANVVQDDGGGGALSLLGVKQASIARSTFEGNVVRTSGGDGGAISAVDSALEVETTLFDRNVAVEGNGGAVAVDGGDVGWRDEEHLIQQCTPATVVVDYTSTTGTCGQYAEEIYELCDNIPEKCSIFLGQENDFYPAAKELCEGCACPHDYIKYFVLTDVDSGREIPVFEKLKGVVDTRGTGHAGSVFAYQLCLPSANYSITAYDDFGQGWWGAGLYVRVEEQGEYAPEPWTGYESSSVAFRVDPLEPCQKSRVVSNSAPLGGGGGVFWRSNDGRDSEPAGLSGGAGLMIFEANVAAYGDDRATETTSLHVDQPCDSGDDDSHCLQSRLEVQSFNAIEPPIKVKLVDAYNSTVVADSLTSVQAAILLDGDFNNSNPIIITRQDIVLTDRGVAAFDQLQIDTGRAARVDLALVFSVPRQQTTKTLSSASKCPLYLTVVLPERPVERQADDVSETPIELLMLVLCLLNLIFAFVCAAWTWRYQKRVIVELSQPGMLYWLCVGCVVSTMSSVAPLLGETMLACQLMVWLYGAGFVITTATLHVKMMQMKLIIERSLRIAHEKKQSSTRSITSVDSNKSIATKTTKTTTTYLTTRVVLTMAFGELAILGLWLQLAPLTYRRTCTEEEEGGAWAGVCTQSRGYCRTDQGPAFVGVLAIYHVFWIVAGMLVCYRVRNIPSVMAEGKWVFTGFYSQLQVFVTAVPVLILVHKQYRTFTVLKSLVICLGDATTLAMVYIPKMWLVAKYGDFSRTAVARFVVQAASQSLGKADDVYEQLRTRRFNEHQQFLYCTKKRPDSSKDNLNSETVSSRGGPMILASPSNSNFTTTIGVEGDDETDEEVNQIDLLNLRQQQESFRKVAKMTVPHHHHHRPRTSSLTSPGPVSPSTLSFDEKTKETLGKTNHYLNHEMKNRLLVLAETECDTETRLAIVDELLEIVGNNSGMLRLATGRYVAYLEELDLFSAIDIRLARYRSASREVVFEPTTGSLAKAVTSLMLDRTVMNIILDNLLSNAFKYGSLTVPPRIAVSVDAIGDTVASVRLTVSNAAGPSHRALLLMGEKELNRIASADGERAHEESASTSAGDGYPMACGSAEVLGGRLWLHLSEGEVIAILNLPEIYLGSRALQSKDDDEDSNDLDTSNTGVENAESAPASPRSAWRMRRPKMSSKADDPPDAPSKIMSPPAVFRSLFASTNEEEQKLALLAIAKKRRAARRRRLKRRMSEGLLETVKMTFGIADDSLVQRKRLARAVKSAFPNAEIVLVAGETTASVTSFSRDVMTADCDCVLVDMNFGLVHHKQGTELVREIRAFEEQEKRGRLVFVASANDTAEDVKMYLAAGADGHISKAVTTPGLRSIIARNAVRHPRFRRRLNQASSSGASVSTTSSSPHVAARVTVTVEEEEDDLDLEDRKSVDFDFDDDDEDDDDDDIDDTETTITNPSKHDSSVFSSSTGASSMGASSTGASSMGASSTGASSSTLAAPPKRSSTGGGPVDKKTCPSRIIL